MNPVRIAEGLLQFSQEGQLMPACFTAWVGEDGLLLVDTGQHTKKEELRSAVQALGYDAPTFIVNTHASLGNVGANDAFGRAPTIIAHSTARAMMQGEGHVLAELSPDALPDLEITGESILHFNGECIRLIPLPGSHSSTDLVIHFPGLGVACIGDIYPGRFFPFATDGGSGLAFPRILRRVQELLPADTKLLCGHQEGISRLSDLDEIIEMAEDTIPWIRAGVEAGKQRNAMMAEGLPERWKHLSRPGATEAGWVHRVYHDFAGPPPVGPALLRPMLEGYKRSAGAGAIAAVREWLAAGNGPERELEQRLLRFGYWLLRDKKAPHDAVRVFRYWTELFPASWNAHDSYAESLAAYGDRASAITHYRKSLELNPENANATTELAKLEVS